MRTLKTSFAVLVPAYFICLVAALGCAARSPLSPLRDHPTASVDPFKKRDATLANAEAPVPTYEVVQTSASEAATNEDMLTDDEILPLPPTPRSANIAPSTTESIARAESRNAMDEYTTSREGATRATTSLQPPIH